MISNTLNIEGEQRRVPFTYYESISTARVHTFYLSEVVGAPEEYIEMIQIIKTAGPEDLIYIYLNMAGGRLDTGVQIINAMRSTQAKVITSLESEAHSLGTLIFLSGDEFIVHEDCMMMIHNFSSGIVGKGNEQVAQLEATVKWFEKLARRIYIPFLSNDEFDRIIRGEDLWLDSDNIQDRLKQMIDTLVAEQEAEEQELVTAKKTAKKKKVTTKKKANKS